MGIFHAISSCSSCSDSPSSPKPQGMPDPKRFHVERSICMGGWTVLLVRYPDATNYEGRKILVYNRPIAELLVQKTLDPHFCEDKSCVSPFARFEPTSRGWDLACLFVTTVTCATM